ncbi:MAG: hypothetical protein ACK4UN_19840, partial [Limisphaerales bacterium]
TVSTFAKPGPSKKSELPFPLWYLFAADCVLVLFAFLLIFKDPAALEWKRVALACIATAIGGLLAATGALLSEK